MKQKGYYFFQLVGMGLKNRMVRMLYLIGSPKRFKVVTCGPRASTQKFWGMSHPVPYPRSWLNMIRSKVLQSLHIFRGTYMLSALYLNGQRIPQFGELCMHVPGCICCTRCMGGLTGRSLQRPFCALSRGLSSLHGGTGQGHAKKMGDIYSLQR